jgi:hypothetical protein
VFRLHTLGALELLRDDGEPVAGAAAQRKPLLILALAALTPGGIPRDRMLRALWPGVPPARARATLKQHLYALRRATGNPRIVAGSPRLRVAEDTVQVDVRALAAHVEQGRLREAGALLRGELLEDLTDAPGEVLGDLLQEIRAAYAPALALVRRSLAAARESGLAVALPTRPRTLPLVQAERGVVDAVREFTRGVIMLPTDAETGFHLVAMVTHALVESLHAAEVAGVSPARIGELVADARTIWHQTELVRLIAVPSSPDAPSDELLEWLIRGGIRSPDPVPRALESWLLDSPVTAHFRARAHWETHQAIRVLHAAESGGPVRLLMVAPRGAPVEIAGLLCQHRCALTIVDGDAAALDLARHRLATLGDRVETIAGDPFDRLGQLRASGPYHLILTGHLYDRMNPQQASWLTEQLVDLLAPGGTLCIASLVKPYRFGPWLRHIAGWPLIERDREDLILLCGRIASECDINWESDPGGDAWMMQVRRHAVGTQAASVRS